MATLAALLLLAYPVYGSSFDVTWMGEEVVTPFLRHLTVVGITSFFIVLGSVMCYFLSSRGADLFFEKRSMMPSVDQAAHLD